MNRTATAIAHGHVLAGLASEAYGVTVRAVSGASVTPSHLGAYCLLLPTVIALMACADKGEVTATLDGDQLHIVSKGDGNLKAFGKTEPQRLTVHVSEIPPGAKSIEVTIGGTKRVVDIEAKAKLENTVLSNHAITRLRYERAGDVPPKELTTQQLKGAVGGQAILIESATLDGLGAVLPAQVDQGVTIKNVRSGSWLGRPLVVKDNAASLRLDVLAAFGDSVLIAPGPECTDPGDSTEVPLDVGDWFGNTQTHNVKISASAAGIYQAMGQVFYDVAKAGKPLPHWTPKGSGVVVATDAAPGRGWFIDAGTANHIAYAVWMVRQEKATTDHSINCATGGEPYERRLRGAAAKVTMFSLADGSTIATDTLEPRDLTCRAIEEKPDERVPTLGPSVWAGLEWAKNQLKKTK